MLPLRKIPSVAVHIAMVETVLPYNVTWNDVPLCSRCWANFQYRMIRLTTLQHSATRTHILHSGIVQTSQYVLGSYTERYVKFLLIYTTTRFAEFFLDSNTSQY